MKCMKCNLEKTETDFVFKNKSKNIKHTVCKVCQREYKKAYYYKNKESHYKRNEKTRDELYEIVRKEKDKGCLICNEKFHECLEFHHLEDDKLGTIASLKRKGSVKKLLIEIAKCVLLCANCHRKVHYDENFNKKMMEKVNMSIV